LTSRQAERDLVSLGMRREKRRETVDAVAAALMLQCALDGASLVPVLPAEGEADADA
jgi:RNase H-fold protein (predicted Holliday junction resolvase)